MKSHSSHSKSVGRFGRKPTLTLLGVAFLAIAVSALGAPSGIVANFSFESPATEFASPVLDSWEKAPQPFWYNDPRFPWAQLTGQFLNPSNGAPDHLENLDGNQAAYLFALPDVAIFQEVTSMGGVKYERGNSFSLTVGVVGGGGGMSNGVPLNIVLYYRNDAGTRVPVVSTSVTNTQELFPSPTRLIDFKVEVPTVRGDEPWTDRLVGVELASGLTLADTRLFGGYWDVDNVRLRRTSAPVLTDVRVNGNRQIQFTLRGEPGRYEILATANPTLPASSWTRVGVVTNAGDSVSVVDAMLETRFYRVRSTP